MHPVLGSQVYFPLDADSLRESLEVEDSGPEPGAETESESPHLELLDLDDIEAVGGPLELERVLDRPSRFSDIFLNFFDRYK